MERFVKYISRVVIPIAVVAVLGQLESIKNVAYAATLQKITQADTKNPIYNFKVITGEKLINVEEGPNVYKADISNNEHKVNLQFDCETGAKPNDFIIEGLDNSIIGSISEDEPILTIVGLKEGTNIIKIKNRADDSELYKFYINYKNVEVAGLKNVVNTGDEFKLDAIIDGKACKNVKWTSIGITSAMISEEGKVTALDNGTANIMATIYYENESNIIGSINVQFNVSGDSKLGWVKNAGKWYYIDKSTKCFKIGWLFYNNEWYNLKDDGSMQTGWIKDKGKWYILDENGAMKTGWVKDNGKWYYLNSDGSMKMMND